MPNRSQSISLLSLLLVFFFIVIPLLISATPSFEISVLNTELFANNVIHALFTTKDLNLDGLKVTSPKINREASVNIEDDPWIFGPYDYLSNAPDTLRYEYPLGKQHVLAHQTALDYTPYSLYTYSCKVYSSKPTSLRDALSTNWLFVSVYPPSTDGSTPSYFQFHTSGIREVLAKDSALMNNLNISNFNETNDDYNIYKPSLISQIKNGITFSCLIPYQNNHFPTNDDLIVSNDDGFSQPVHLSFSNPPTTVFGSARLDLVHHEWIHSHKTQFDPFPLVSLKISFTSTQGGPIYFAPRLSKQTPFYFHFNNSDSLFCSSGGNPRYAPVLSQKHTILDTNGDELVIADDEHITLNDRSSLFVALPIPHTGSTIVECVLTFKLRYAVSTVPILISNIPLYPAIFPSPTATAPGLVQFSPNLPNVPAVHTDIGDSAAVNFYYVNAYTPTLTDLDSTRTKATISFDIRSFHLTSQSTIDLFFPTNLPAIPDPSSIITATSDCTTPDGQSHSITGTWHSQDHISLTLLGVEELYSIPAITCQVLKNAYILTKNQQGDRLFTPFSMIIDKKYTIKPYGFSPSETDGTYGQRYNIQLAIHSGDHYSWVRNKRYLTQFKVNYVFDISFHSLTPWSPVVAFYFDNADKPSNINHQKVLAQTKNKLATPSTCSMSDSSTGEAFEKIFDISYQPEDQVWLLPFLNFFVNKQNQTLHTINSFTVSCDLYLPAVREVPPLNIQVLDRYEYDSSHYSSLGGPHSTAQFPAFKVSDEEYDKHEKNNDDDDNKIEQVPSELQFQACWNDLVFENEGNNFASTQELLSSAVLPFIIILNQVLGTSFSTNEDHWYYEYTILNNQITTIDPTTRTHHASVLSHFSYLSSLKSRMWGFSSKIVNSLHSGGMHNLNMILYKLNTLCIKDNDTVGGTSSRIVTNITPQQIYTILERMATRPPGKNLNRFMLTSLPWYNQPAILKKAYAYDRLLPIKNTCGANMAYKFSTHPGQRRLCYLNQPCRRDVDCAQNIIQSAEISTTCSPIGHVCVLNNPQDYFFDEGRRNTLLSYFNSPSCATPTSLEWFSKLSEVVSVRFDFHILQEHHADKNTVPIWSWFLIVIGFIALTLAVVILSIIVIRRVKLMMAYDNVNSYLMEYIDSSNLPTDSQHTTLHELQQI